MKQAAAVVVAAGRGTRMQLNDNKVFLDLLGVPLLAHTLKPFIAHPQIAQIVIVSALHEADRVLNEVLCHVELDTPIDICVGGDARQDSVFQGVKQTNPSLPLVLVHDGARPLVTASLIDRVLIAADEYGAAFPGVSVTESLKCVDDSGWLERSPKREGLFFAQTPQGFERERLIKAHEQASRQGQTYTDDVGVFQAHNDRPVKMVDGDPQNIKVTVPSDLICIAALKS